VKTALVQKIDAILPQTQCGQCGYSGCKPYAIAVANGEADIDQCPPGGQKGIDELAALLGVPGKVLNTAHGVTKAPAVAVIDESLCIGCTLCIQACPVDAIVGAAKVMHTVVAGECTGCELCIAPCPVDCISMKLITDAPDKSAANRWRARHEFHLFRAERDKTERAQRLATRRAGDKPSGSDSAAGAAPLAVDASAEAKRAAIQAAIERVKAKRARMAGTNK
jgi:electron transport complex protein RnfB